MLTGVTVNPNPLQTLTGMVSTAGFGFTVTVIWNTDPVQEPETAVTVYIAVCTVEEVLTSVPFMLAEAPPDGNPPTRLPETEGAAHVYVVTAGTVPFTPSEGITLNVPPLHIVAAIGNITAFGLRVTVSVKGAPGQLPLTGVTVYVAVCTVLVVLVRVPLITAAPLPAVPPV